MTTSIRVCSEVFSVHQYESGCRKQSDYSGAQPLNTASTAGWRWYFRKKRLINIMSINEGNTTEKVATVEPNMPAACE